MARVNKLQWHFNDYPTTDDPVIAKTTFGEVMIAAWDTEKEVWYDLGRDWDWFGAGIACWAYIPNLPSTTDQMPRPIKSPDKAVMPYSEKGNMA